MSTKLPPFEVTRLEKFYKFKGLLWRPVHTITHTTGVEADDIEHIPYCPKCKATLYEKSDCELYCELCEVSYKAIPSVFRLSLLASTAYNARLKEGWVVQTLDLPPGIVKDEDENDDFWIEVRLGQKMVS